MDKHIKKIIAGFAQSDSEYGLSKNKNFYSVVNNLDNFGINKIDTSPKYKNSYKYVSKIEKLSNFKITTKLGDINCQLKDIKKTVNEKINQILKKNSIKKIDTLLIHDPLLPLDGARWNEIYKSLKNLKKKKIIDKIGVSVYTVQETKNILKVFKPEVIQFPINVFNQEFLQDNFIYKLKKEKIILVARSIFLQGVLVKKKIPKKIGFIFQKKLTQWKNYLNLNNYNAEAICLNFILDLKIIDFIIIGFDNLLNLKKNIKIIKKFKEFNNDLSDFYDRNDIFIDPRFWGKKINLKHWNDWNEMQSYIGSGSMLLSKKPIQFLPLAWPVFYKKAKGCHIWDKYNKKYLDFSLMGVGTNIIGYSNSFVNRKNKKVIEYSNVSTLNSDYDLKLSKKLISLHPWASKALFARTGAEANAIALRLARAYSKKDEVAICGYHGWHDWYLSSNLNNKKNLDQILLPGLSTIGIPKKLEGITYPFKYNDLKSLKKILKKNKNIGTIFMEVERNEKPEKNFLKEIRKIAHKENLVLIFDECSSGFRETFGGLHKKYKVYPDIAVFGKSIANGIPLTTVIGTNEIMKYSNKSFISSTFWTDNLGPASALHTLEQMEKYKSWKKISLLGKEIKKAWKFLAKKYHLSIKIYGLDAMPSFQFISLKNQYYKNFLTQEMLKKNILATNTVYCCLQHNKYLKIYFKELEKIFKKIKEFENGENIMMYLENPLSNEGFSRLN